MLVIRLYHSVFTLYVSLTHTPTICLKRIKQPQLIISDQILKYVLKETDKFRGEKSRIYYLSGPWVAKYITHIRKWKNTYLNTIIIVHVNISILYLYFRNLLQVSSSINRMKGMKKISQNWLNRYEIWQLVGINSKPIGHKQDYHPIST